MDFPSLTQISLLKLSDYTILYNEKYFSDDHFSYYSLCHYMRAWIPYFLEISPRRDLISSRCTLRRDFTGGEISRAARFRGRRLVHSPASRLLVLSIVRIARVRLHSIYFESDDPFPYGEISRVAFIGTNLLIGVAGFRGNTVRVLDAPGCYESAGTGGEKVCTIRLRIGQNCKAMCTKKSGLKVPFNCVGVSVRNG